MLVQPKTIRPINSGHPLYKNINGFYMLNNNSGESVVDLSPHRNDFVFPDTNKPSWEGEGIEFNTDYARLDSTANGSKLITPSGTVAFLYQNTTARATYHYFLSPTSGYSDMSFYMQSSSARLYHRGNYSELSVTDDYDDGTPKIIVVSWSLGLAELTINGIMNGSSVGVVDMPSSITTLGFGGRRDATYRAVDGVITWAIFLNRFLTVDEINEFITADLPNELLRREIVNYVSAVTDIEGTIDGSVSIDGLVEAEQTREGTVDGSVSIDGLIEVEQTREGTVDGSVSIDGLIDGSVSIDGLITGLVQSDVEGTIDGSVNVDGLVEAEQTREGTIDGSVSVDGLITGSLGISATIDGSVSIDGLITSELTNLSTIDGSVNVDGLVEVEQTREGTIDGSVSIDGLITGSLGISATIDGSVSVDGLITSELTNLSTIDGSVNVDGLVEAEQTREGTIDGSVSIDGLITGLVQPDIEGTIAGSVSIEGLISAFTQVEFNTGFIGGIVGPIRGYFYERRDPLADFGFKTHVDIVSSFLKLPYPQLIYPIMNINKNDVANGTILLKEGLITTINTIGLYVYEAEQVTLGGISYWRTTTANLRNSAIMEASAYTERYKQKINWRFDPTALPSDSNSLYYGLFLKVNEADDASIGQAYIELVVKILNNLIA